MLTKNKRLKKKSQIKIIKKKTDVNFSSIAHSVINMPGKKNSHIEQMSEERKNMHTHGH